MLFALTEDCLFNALVKFEFPHFLESRTLKALVHLVLLDFMIEMRLFH